MKIQTLLLIAILQISGNFAKICDKVHFMVHTKNTPTFESKMCNNKTLLDACDVNGPWVVIVHQWLNGDKIKWKDRLIEGFVNATNGCVIWMDYSYYSSKTLPQLMIDRPKLTDYLAKRLRYMEELGFNPDNGMLFGFSIGSHFVLEAGYKYGPKKIGRADCCDPIAAGFTSLDPSVGNTSNCAKQVQCMHTSSDFGTMERYCPNAVNLGVCGLYQPEGLFSWAESNHLCAEYYIASFTNDFNLVTKAAVEQKYTTYCFPKKTVPDVSTYDPPKKMGWQFDFTLPEGEFYCIPNATAMEAMANQA